MTITEIRDRAFRVIQNDPTKYHAWVGALTQADRDNMLLLEVFLLGKDAGYNEGFKEAKSWYHYME